MFKRVKFSKKPEINEWLFPKTTVILISGKAGVGKTTTANYIKNHLDNEITPFSMVTHFALGVKEVAKFLGWDGNKDTKGRRLLQELGNVGREYDVDVWIKYLLDFIRRRVPDELFEVMIIDDWRFPNESKYFLDKPELYKVFTINIRAPKREVLKGTGAYKDVSETALDGYSHFDYILDNSGTLEELEALSVNVLFDIIEKSKKGGKK